MIDIVETKPDDQICCVETNLNVDFAPPKDYVEPAPIKKSNSVEKRAVEEEKDNRKLAELEEKYKRIDGKALTAKQKRDLLAKVKEQEQAENPTFDPRRHRLKHGIRNYRAEGEAQHEIGAFEGKGVKIG